MSSTPTPQQAPVQSRRTLLIGSALVALVFVAMALDTTVVRIGSEGDVRQQAFSPDTYGAAEFPRIQANIEGRAVDALTLAPEVIADKAAAAEKYGTRASTGSIVPVRLTGVAGESKAGVYTLAVEGLPQTITVRVQTGPAVNGTDLRDAPGDIAIGQFRNQIEYQNAGSAINREMKKQVLDGIDAANLKGKTIEVVGAFRLVNPQNWLVTPVRVAVK